MKISPWLSKLQLGKVDAFLRHSVFSGLPIRDFQRLQSVLNATVRMVVGASRRDHVTSSLRERHRLPIHQRVEYKLCVLCWLIAVCMTTPHPICLTLHVLAHHLDTVPLPLLLHVLATSSRWNFELLCLLPPSRKI